jgi:hypothetical protein
MWLNFSFHCTSLICWNVNCKLNYCWIFPTYDQACSIIRPNSLSFVLCMCTECCLFDKDYLIFEVRRIIVCIGIVPQRSWAARFVGMKEELHEISETRDGSGEGIITSIAWVSSSSFRHCTSVMALLRRKWFTWLDRVCRRSSPPGVAPLHYVLLVPFSSCQGQYQWIKSVTIYLTLYRLITW